MNINPSFTLSKYVQRGFNICLSPLTYQENHCKYKRLQQKKCNTVSHLINAKKRFIWRRKKQKKKKTFSERNVLLLLQVINRKNVWYLKKKTTLKENHCKNKRHRKRNVFTLPSLTKRQKLIYWGEKHHFAICTAFQLLNLFNCKHQPFNFF